MDAQALVSLEAFQVPTLENLGKLQAVTIVNATIIDVVFLVPVKDSPNVF